MCGFLFPYSLGEIYSIESFQSSAINEKYICVHHDYRNQFHSGVSTQVVRIALIRNRNHFTCTLCEKNQLFCRFGRASYINRQYLFVINRMNQQQCRADIGRAETANGNSIETQTLLATNKISMTVDEALSKISKYSVHSSMCKQRKWLIRLSRRYGHL